MYIKPLLLGLALVCASFSTFAQGRVDRIYRKNGEVIRAATVTTSSGMVTYRLASDPNGPEYTLSRGDIVKIKYASGGEQLFDGGNYDAGAPEPPVQQPVYGAQSAYAAQPAPPTADQQPANYGHNKTILAFAPIQFTEHGYGLGLSYERTLDRAGWISFYMPALLTFSFVQDDYNSQTGMFYLLPGVKLYTNLNSAQRCKYSIGPSLVLGAGNARYGDGTYSNPYEVQSHFLMGAMVNLGVNMLATPHLYLGAEWGLGLTYVNQYNGVTRPVEFLTQVGFKIGYRYMNKM